MLNISYNETHEYPYFSFHLFTGEKKSSNAGLIVGATMGSLLLVLVICAGIYIFFLKGKVKNAIKNSSPFGKLLCFSENLLPCCDSG